MKTLPMTIMFHGLHNILKSKHTNFIKLIAKNRHEQKHIRYKKSKNDMIMCTSKSKKELLSNFVYFSVQI